MDFSWCQLEGNIGLAGPTRFFEIGTKKSCPKEFGMENISSQKFAMHLIGTELVSVSNFVPNQIWDGFGTK